MPPRKTKSSNNSVEARVPSKRIGTEDFLKIMPYLDDEVIARTILGVNDFQSAIESFMPKETVAGYPTDPEKFMTDVLGYKTWNKLEAICKSIEHNHNTIVSSGYAVGKSCASAAIICWWMTIHEDAKVIVIAPTFMQIQNILFRYIRDVGRKANLPGRILDSPRWEVSPDHFAIGLSPRRSTSEDIASLQGYHSPHLLVVMDEGAGLPRIIWDAAAGLAAGDNCRQLVLGNPIEQAGPFWDACDNNQYWKHINISDFDHPNVITGEEVIPGAVTRRWIEERASEWAVEVPEGTPESIKIPWLSKWVIPQPIFYAKVMGIAPEQAEDQLIKLAWVIEAQERILEQKNVETIAGLDPARKGGDTSVLIIRYGNQVMRIIRYNQLDLIQLTERVAIELRECGVSKCYVDAIGLGSGVVDYGRKIGLPMIEVNSSRTASQRKRFANLRAECWWRLREALREGKLQIPTDSLLAGDLTAPKYFPDLYQRIQIEGKDEIRERIKRSPDTGDALALTYASASTDVGIDVMQGLRALGRQEGVYNPNAISRWSIVKQHVGSKWKR